MRFNFIRIVLFLLFSTLSGVLVASDNGYAVAGSYKSLVNAESMAVSIKEWLSESGVPGIVRVAESSTGTQKLNRVLIQPGEGMSARSVISLLRQGGYPGAWFLPATQLKDIPVKNLSMVSKPVPIEETDVAKVEHSIPGVGDTVAKKGLLPVKTASGGEGAKTLIDFQDGIPRHQISVRNFLEKDVDIDVDGKVDEVIWQQVEAHDNMLVAVPGTGAPASYKTG